MRFKKAADIKVGVVGYGGSFDMGRGHLNEMKKAGMTPFAVAEIDAARLAVAAKDFPGIQTYSSLDAMLRKSDVNLIVVITPHNTHAKLALAALNAGRHAVCEKPMAITTAECDAMIAAAKKHSVVLSTYHNRHWDGFIMQAVQHLRSENKVGEIVRVEAHMGGYGAPGDQWRSSKSISGGILYDWGVHLLEYGLQLIDSDIVEVSGFAHTGFWGPRTKWQKDCNEDEALALVRFKNGSRLSLQMSSIDSHPRPGLIEVTGTLGSYVIGDASCNVLYTWAIADQKIVRYRNPESEGWRFYQNVADHLVKGTELVIAAEWARRPIHILDLAVQSAKKNATMKAKYK